MNTLFCRHNRFTADCPICSRGTVLDESRAVARPRARSDRLKGARAATPRSVRQVTGPYVACGPYSRDDGNRYDVRLERVPGGIRLGQWCQGTLERRAPVLRAPDLTPLVEAARERSVLRPPDLEALEVALSDGAGVAAQEVQGFGASPGRAGELREELRAEPIADGWLRVARWIYRPNAGWELQDAPTMLPAARYAQAFAGAARAGYL